MPDPPLVSVIIPTHGRGELLAKSVQSVLRQTVQDFEVIVVVDGGDGVGLEPMDQRVRVMARERQGGAAAARNDGIAAARGRFVTFLDDDDEFTSDRLALGLEGLAHAPIALCWKADLLTGDLRWSRTLAGRVEGLLLEAPVPQLGSVLVKRDLLLPMDDSLRVSEDVEWWLRMSQVAPVHTVCKVGYLLRDHDGDRLTRRTAARLQARVQILDQHHHYFELHRRAAAYQWRRAGGLARAIDDYPLALRCFRQAFFAQPSIRPLGHLATTALRGSVQPILSGRGADTDRIG